MADVKARRIRRWTAAVLTVILGLPLIALALRLWIKSAEERRWADMRSWCAKVAQDVRARPSTRPVLRGEAVPGNAWDDYEEALRSIESPKDLLITAPYLNDPNVDRAKVFPVVERYAPAVQAIRRGASRAKVGRHFDWENSLHSWDSKLNQLACLAACKARFVVDEGHPRDAMELLLDTAQYGEDTAMNGTHIDGLIALLILNVVQDELRRLLVLRKILPEDCRQLVRELELLDRSFPREAEAHAVDSMPTGFAFLRQENMETVLKDMGITDRVSPTWRYGFSERLVIVDAFQEGCAIDRQLQAAATKPWKEARQIQERLSADRSWKKNPLLRKFGEIQEMLSNPAAPRNLYRERLAQLRLLRCAAAYRSAGEVPVLDDPYGDKIRSSITGTRLKVWSVGGDGVDDGGSGEWDLRKGGKDIVLEVER